MKPFLITWAAPGDSPTPHSVLGVPSAQLWALDSFCPCLFLTVFQKFHIRETDVWVCVCTGMKRKSLKTRTFPKMQCLSQELGEPVPLKYTLPHSLLVNKASDPRS